MWVMVIGQPSCVMAWCSRSDSKRFNASQTAVMRLEPLIAQGMYFFGPYFESHASICDSHDTSSRNPGSQ